MFGIFMVNDIFGYIWWLKILLKFENEFVKLGKKWDLV